MKAALLLASVASALLLPWQASALRYHDSGAAEFNGREVYASVLTEDQQTYLPGLQALAMSVRDHDETRPFLVLTMSEPIEGLREAAACLNLTLLRVPVINTTAHEVPESKEHDLPREDRYRITYARLSILALPATRVVSLDADTVVLKDLEELFQGEAPFRAAWDCPLYAHGACPVPGIFQPGVMALQPSSAIFGDMVQNFTPHFDEEGGTHYGDRTMLRAYFKDVWEQDNSSHLDPNYNAIRDAEDFWGVYNWSDTRVLHNVNTPKPWQQPEGEGGQGQKLWQNAYDAYEKRCNGTGKSLSLVHEDAQIWLQQFSQQWVQNICGFLSCQQ